jgi:hypothetical protein
MRTPFISDPALVKECAVLWRGSVEADARGHGSEFSRTLRQEMRFLNRVYIMAADFLLFELAPDPSSVMVERSVSVLTWNMRFARARLEIATLRGMTMFRTSRALIGHAAALFDRVYPRLGSRGQPLEPLHAARETVETAGADDGLEPMPWGATLGSVGCCPEVLASQMARLVNCGVDEALRYQEACEHADLMLVDEFERWAPYACIREVIAQVSEMPDVAAAASRLALATGLFHEHLRVPFQWSNEAGEDEDLTCAEAMEVVHENVALFLQLTGMLSDIASPVKRADVMSMYFTPRPSDEAFTRAYGVPRLSSHQDDVKDLQALLLRTLSYSRPPEDLVELHSHDLWDRWDVLFVRRLLLFVRIGCVSASPSATSLF